MTVPKYKREIRKAIIRNVEQNKNVYSLRKLYIVSDIERRAYDDELCQTVEKREWSIQSSISSLLKCNEKSISALDYFIRGLLRAEEEQKKTRQKPLNN